MGLVPERSADEPQVRLLAVVDLVGMADVGSQSRARLIRSATERTRNILRAALTASAEVSSLKFQKTADLQYSHDETMFVLSTNVARAGIPLICVVTADICIALLRVGLLPRGAIVIGSLLHTRTQLFGAALDEAQALAFAQRAPRVTITAEADKVLSTFWERPHEDDDGTRFLNIFRIEMLKDGALAEICQHAHAAVAAQGAAGEAAQWLLQRIAKVQAAAIMG